MVTGAETRYRCMKLWGSFHITLEPGQGTRPFVALCSGAGPCSCLGSDQCEYTMTQEPASYKNTETHFIHLQFPVVELKLRQGSCPDLTTYQLQILPGIHSHVEPNCKIFKL